MAKKDDSTKLDEMLLRSRGDADDTRADILIPSEVEFRFVLKQRLKARGASQVYEEVLALLDRFDLSSVSQLTPTPESPASATERLDQLDREVRQQQSLTIKNLNDLFSSLSEPKFSTLAERREFAAKIRRLLAASNGHVICPKCNKPALLRCSVVGNAKEGAFQFVHTHPKQTVHGATASFPAGVVAVSKTE